MIGTFWTGPHFNWLDNFDLFSLASPTISTKVLENSSYLPFYHLKPSSISHLLRINALSTWLDGERWAATTSLAAVCRAELTIKVKGGVI